MCCLGVPPVLTGVNLLAGPGTGLWTGPVTGVGGAKPDWPNSTVLATQMVVGSRPEPPHVCKYVCRKDIIDIYRCIFHAAFFKNAFVNISLCKSSSASRSSSATMCTMHHKCWIVLWWTTVHIRIFLCRLAISLEVWLFYLKFPTSPSLESQFFVSTINKVLAHIK